MLHSMMGPAFPLQMDLMRLPDSKLAMGEGDTMSRRTERVNELLRMELSELLQRHIRDPRLSCFITITDVETSPDLRYAKVFVSILGSDEERKEAMAALSAASNFMRHELGERLTFRYTPVLSFRYDSSIERGSHILKLIDEISEEESEKGNA